METLIEKGLDIGDKAVVNQDARDEHKVKLMIAELQSDSSLVKKIRPYIVIFGLVVIGLEILGVRIGLLLLMDAGIDVIRNSTTLVEFFIVTWSGIVGTYVLGRTNEKKTTAMLIANRIQQIQESRQEVKEQKKDNRVDRSHQRRLNRQERKQNRRTKRK